jgi:hypothetical protein
VNVSRRGGKAIRLLIVVLGFLDAAILLELAFIDESHSRSYVLAGEAIVIGACLGRLWWESERRDRKFRRLGTKD